MITGPLAAWSDAVLQHEDSLSDWVVTKLEHRKNFHFSAVMHEFLKCTVQQLGQTSQEERHIFVERMADKDEVTVGWKFTEYPKLARWWLQRLVQGYFSDETRGGVSLLASSSALNRWKAIGYSGSDYLCHLDFTQNLLPLSKFRQVLVDSSNSAPKYSVTDANCFWFAHTVYETLKKDYHDSEHTGGYYKLRGNLRTCTLSGTFVTETDLIHFQAPRPSALSLEYVCLAIDVYTNMLAYLASATSGFESYLLDHMRKSVNVMHFGAQGVGVRDDAWYD
ncbi:hypothetical protein GGR52DRAFT_572511 [Hypoxylon sp. FL1284]|nr:hypothetical protein GGR52DRAFT_572511 [Hypoxylon sp. FL1284]